MEIWKDVYVNKNVAIFTLCDAYRHMYGFAQFVRCSRIYVFKFN